MRKSISVALFSMVSTLLVLGIAVMGCSEWVLFGRYFAQERYEALDGVADVARRTADYVVQNASLPEGEELEVLNARLEIIGESAEACLFFTDPEGRVMLSSSSSQVVGTQVPLALFDEVEPQGQLPSAQQSGGRPGRKELCFGKPDAGCRRAAQRVSVFVLLRRPAGGFPG